MKIVSSLDALQALMPDLAAEARSRGAEFEAARRIAPDFAHRLKCAGVARMLVQGPRLILADEPIASLDPRNAQVVMDALRRINREDGLSVLCNLHHLDTARAYCDRILGLRAGRIVFDGPPSALTPAMAREIYGVSEAEFHAAPQGSLAVA